MNASARKLLRSGDPFIWLSGGCLALILVLLFGLFAVILENGLPAFWPSRAAAVQLKNGQSLIGEISAREQIPGHTASAEPEKYRLEVKRGNRDLYGSDFVWTDDADIARIDYPSGIIALERQQWGNFYGFPEALKEGERVVAAGSEAAWKELQARLPRVLRLVSEISKIERKEISEISSAQNELRLAARSAADSQKKVLEKEAARLEKQYADIEGKLAAKRALLTESVILRAAGGETKQILLSDIVRAYRPNDMTLLDRVLLYLSRIKGFLTEDPRESNTEGGVFPALFGTIMMVILMSAVATPLGVLAAIYLHEYARPGPFTSLVRVGVNNLAGVPSIVFGVFGLGFFVYYVGGSIDRLFFSDSLPNPTFGTGGILWAALTLALLTMPTVIVAAEEGLSAIPKSLREASYALGATKWETTCKAVLPSLVPSILTGLILAVARAAGEVAPLMITGVVKLAPSLPVDTVPPFLHLDRKFMHLGFHIYDVGFQSPNVDAARPVVYATTILLLVIVVLLNVGAIVVRNRLRKKFSSAGV